MAENEGGLLPMLFEASAIWPAVVGGVARRGGGGGGGVFRLSVVVGGSNSSLRRGVKAGA